MKILCLHGFATNASIMRKQLSPLIASPLLRHHTFETIDAPIVAKDTFDNIKYFFPDETDWFQWFEMEVAPSAAPKTAPLVAVGTETVETEAVETPTRSKYSPYTTESVERTIDRLKPHLVGRDCVLGFSQGAAVVSLLVQLGLVRRAILVAHGRMIRLDSFCSASGATSLHLIGTKDPYRELGELAFCAYSGSAIGSDAAHNKHQVHRFDGDHKIPYDTESVRRIADYLQTI